MSKISVFVRVRPLNEQQKKSFALNDRIEPDSDMREVRVFNENNDKAKVFKFNKIFQPNYSQQQIFQQAEAFKLVQKVIEGYHSTIFAYGQTGSGKTYTMEGFDYEIVDGTPKICGNIDEHNKSLGIIPRAIRHLFAKIQKDTTRTYQVSLSYLQIYNQKIFDLLDYDNKEKLNNGLKLRWNKYDQFIVEGLQSLACRNINDALSLYLRGARNKIMAKHKMNLSSSRSHTILTIRVQSFDNEDPKNILSSKLELVDLAGSEKQSITGTVGKIFREGIEINKSLFTLRQVISSLFEYNKNINKTKDSDIHIPYRESKLTSILKQSIGGNNYCVMIACINPGDAYLQESIQTLTYASMATYIANIPIRNEDPKIQQIKQLKQQLAQVTEQLQRANEHIKLLSELANKRIEGQNKPEIDNLTTANIGLNMPIRTMSKQNEKTQLRTSQDSSNKPQQSQFIKKTGMRPKEFIESINMIKDLLQSNIALRENMQKLTRKVDQKDKELYQVIKENQVLRERWQVVGGMIAENQQKQQTHYRTAEDKKNISVYERMLEEKNGIKPISLRKFNSGRLDQSEPKKQLNLSYNELLRQGTKKSQPKKRKYNVPYI